MSGQSVAYEGTVHVTVTQDRRGADRVLGKGFVNGGGTELAPFLGTIRFASPTPGIDAGWVVFSGDTGADTGIIEATAVRVRFVNSDHRPQILGVSTNPPASGSARLVTLTGSGTLGVKVKAFGADEVRVLLVPSGTDARSHAKLLGVDTTAGADGESWSVSWRYPDQSFHGPPAHPGERPGRHRRARRHRRAPHLTTSSSRAGSRTAPRSAFPPLTWVSAHSYAPLR